MIIFYRPGGIDSGDDTTPEQYDAGRLRASEIQIAERTADRAWAAIKYGVRDGDIGALRVVAWVLMKRTNPSLRFAEFDPFEGEVWARLDAKEVRGYAKEIVGRYGDNPDDLAEAMDELRDAAADREDAERAIADATAPKDQASAEQTPATELPEMSPASASE
ncbi:hypothetical protein ACIGCZ_15215 [Streptomyces nigra]|uniref:hypothetical protein n=1 Tax=Streptomyces nigra TaxID=1827580 RepID=UPI0037D4BADF